MKKWLVLGCFIVFGLFTGLALAHDRVDEIIQKALERSRKAAATRERLEEKIQRLKRETGAECFTTASDCARAAEIILSDNGAVKALKRISLRDVVILIFYNNTETMPYVGDAGGVFIPSDVTIERLKKYLGVQ